MISYLMVYTGKSKKYQNSSLISKELTHTSLVKYYNVCYTKKTKKYLTFQKKGVSKY